MMQALKKVGVVVVIIASMASLCNAAAIGTYGDFTVFDTCIDTCVKLFDSGTNPSPFPSAVAIQMAATYPAAGGSLTVGQMQTYLAGQGYPSNNFLVLFKIGSSGSATLQNLQISIGGTAVADGKGATFSMAAGNDFCFDPKLNLGEYGSSATIQIAYVTQGGGYENVDIIKLGTTPEPISMAFLGTGLLGMVLMRRKRKEA